MDFDQDGLLPPLDYPLTINDLRQSLLVVGPQDGSPWDTKWRMKLVDNLEIMVQQLWEIGVTDIFIDGSFVEQKAHPNDIDGYFVCDYMDYINGDIERNLNVLDPNKIWTWKSASRRPYRNYTKLQLPMWHKYRVELYPHYGQSSGIRDEFGNEQKFPAAFRKTRDTFSPKGIVKILK
ncbi:MAG: hypothetical protein A2201_04525 [Alicyclobacillus sp. RIFOXYA1_FULL_53_8]|nr:MAG: hypothetical protein A2201_04525 [Alicyclobacillus sp. RIFOXYA1_FULL_53_8]